MPPRDGPLLVHGPWSNRYDFGPGHPLTPRRFGPGIDLLRAIGAEPGLAPEPAPDEALELVHDARYIAVVKELSADPSGPPRAGLGPGDNPPFPGMHEAAAAVGDGSLRAIDAILRGDVGHAQHPGGGLHHAMRDRASGFCVYDDPALAIARARRQGRRVLYVDLDVHHGDGVEAIFREDPGVLTMSFHESGRYLFPGTGRASEVGEGTAAGTIVNVPFEPPAGDGGWWPAVRRLVPELAAAFGPDVVVSQHGADSHAWDPLAHLRITTAAMNDAARLVDAVAHRWGGGRWLSTGGGGYDVYRVVPRTWALTWLAGAHRDVPDGLPAAWRERWVDDAERWRQAPLPERFIDAPNAGMPVDRAQELAEALAGSTVALVRRAVVPELVREAVDRGWWAPLDGAPKAIVQEASGGEPSIVDLGGAGGGRLRLAPRVIAPMLDPGAGWEIVEAAFGEGGRAVAAVVGDLVVGLALAVPDRVEPSRNRLVALGVAPAYRRQGIGAGLLERLVQAGGRFVASVTLAERDPVEPLDRGLRNVIARRLLERAGFRVNEATDDLARIDQLALVGIRDQV